MWKKLLTLMVTGILLFGLSVCTVSAAGTSYTYRVTIYAGNQGNFSGIEGIVLNSKNATVVQTEDKIVISGLDYGDEVAYTAQSDIHLDADSKYYVQGIRLAGRDNDTVAASAFIVKSDVDYVVAYGIKGNQVSYTVNYHDQYGNEMLPSETFYGNVGDKPVIACKYVDGYYPQASGLTKTLKENAAENILTFIYKPIPGPTVETIITTIVKEEYVDGVQVVPGSSSGNSGTGTGGTDAGGTGEDGESGEEIGDEDENSETGEGNTTGDGGTDSGEGSQEGEDIIIDLDDEDTPLANLDPIIDEPDKFLSMLGYVGLVLAAMAALVVLTVVSFMLRRRGKEESEEENEEA